MLCSIYTTVPKAHLKAGISIPFNGLPSFLHCLVNGREVYTSVSMPFNGLLSFLQQLT